MSRTRTQLRQATAREVGLDIFRTGSFNSSGGTTTTAVDDALTVLPADQAIGAWIYPTAGADAGTDFQITDSATNGTLTYRPAASAALNSDAYELLPFRAGVFHSSINDSIVELAANGILRRNFWIRGLVTGSPGYNSGFDYWTSAILPDGYSVSSGSVSRSSPGPVSTQCARLAASTTLIVDANYRRYFRDLQNTTVTLYAWVKTATGSKARISLNVDGTDNWSSYHSGNGEWELLSTEVAVGTSVDAIYPSFAVASGVTADVGDWFTKGGSVYEYPWPFLLAPEGPEDLHISLHTEADATTPLTLHQPRRESIPATYAMHVEEAANTRTYAWLSGLPTSGAQRMLIKTSGPLSQLSTDAGVTEVTERQGMLIAKSAAAKILIDYRNRVTPSLSNQIDVRLGRLERDIERLELEVTSNDFAADLPWKW